MEAASVADRELAAERRRRIVDALTEAGTVQDLGRETPEFTENAEVVLARRYLSKDREGAVLESPDGMFRAGGPQPFPGRVGLRLLRRAAAGGGG